MEENRINEISKMSLSDKFCYILKAIGSYCSYTAPIVSLLSDFQNHKQNLLIEDMLKKAFAQASSASAELFKILYAKA